MLTLNDVEYFFFNKKSQADNFQKECRLEFILTKRTTDYAVYVVKNPSGVCLKKAKRIYKEVTR